jgi:hypothetical protein
VKIKPLYTSRTEVQNRKRRAAVDDRSKAG